ncbi:MAG: ABC transporter substrate-binding protein [Synergistaceae bacterium]|jgi:NitT/TauT family transport system substrate-binding protein|nr:ABC transporter substrate-binding protein [Synergistaceae bacterium]
MKRSIGILVVLMVSLSLFAEWVPASSAFAASQDPGKTVRKNEIVRVGFTAAVASMTWSPLIVAKMLGYFDEEGIDIVMEQSYSSSATKMVAAGQTEFSTPGPHLTAAAIEGGMDVLSVYQLFPIDIFGFAVRNDGEIKTVADLAGKKIASMTPTTINQIIPILEAGGVDPKGVEVIPVGDARVQMLTERSVDACWTWDGEWQQWQAEGMPIAFVSGETVYKSCSNSMIAKIALVKEYPDLIERFYRALAKASYYIYCNPKAAADITLKEWTSIKINLDAATKIMETALVPMLGGKNVLEGKTIGMHNKSSWELVMADYVKMGIVKAPIPTEKCFTNQFIEGINKFDRAPIKAAAEAYSAY